jgi:SNF2 family DNA or RNA helicase
LGLARDTVEETILQLQDHKRNLADAIIGRQQRDAEPHG